MATKNSTSTLQRATHPTAPLPAPAVAAVARLDLRLNAPEVLPAVARYRSAETRANELMAIARTGRMSDLNADDLAHYIDLMAGAKATLAKAGRLDLIGAVA